MWILKGLKKHLPKGVEEKLNKVVGGRDFAALDKDSSSRNTQFELRIASYFCQAGYSVDMSDLTDIVATHDRTTYFVECKRVTSSSALNKRLKEAKKQLKTRLARFSLIPREFGVIAIDVTKVAFKFNGLTSGLTAKHTKDVIQDQLKKIDDELIKSGFTLGQKNLLLLWLQIHIPALVINPSHSITRFSSLFVGNGKLLGRSAEALKKLHPVLRMGDERDKREIPPKTLNFRKLLTIPKGTIFSWDEGLLKGMLDSWNLEPREPKHTVLEVVIDGKKTEYSFFELSLLLHNLSEEDRLKFSNDHKLAMAELMARLILQRSPYEEDE
jgi:Holliday junction resolvase